MQEQLIIAAILKDRGAFDEFEKHGDRGSFGPIAGAVYGFIERYYQNDGSCRDVDRGLLEEQIAAALPNPKHADAARQFLAECPRDVSVSNVRSLIQEQRRAVIGDRLSLALANRSPIQEVEKLIGEYQGAGALGVEPSDEGGVLDVVSKALEPKENNEAEIIKLWPKSLNDAVGARIKRGHHILIFAYTNVGKTTFTVNMVFGFLKQGLKVLYVGNEESTVWERIAGRIVKAPYHTLHPMTDDIRQKLEVHAGQITYVNYAEFSSVRKEMERKKYDVVVLDQVRGMRLKADGRTAELEAAGIEARALARDFNALAVSVTQGNASTEHKVYLSTGDIDSSKVGIPGSTDVIIGLGADEPMRANGLIGVSVCKSKFGPNSTFTASVNFATGVVS